MTQGHPPPPPTPYHFYTENPSGRSGPDLQLTSAVENGGLICQTCYLLFVWPCQCVEAWKNSLGIIH